MIGTKTHAEGEELVLEFWIKICSLEVNMFFADEQLTRYTLQTNIMLIVQRKFREHGIGWSEVPSDLLHELEYTAGRFSRSFSKKLVRSTTKAQRRKSALSWGP